MMLQNMLPTLSALSGIAILTFGALCLKSHLKRSFCC